jgi:hypothetical protein
MTKDLESAAIEAYHAGKTFAEFWERYGADVAQAVPRDRFQGFYKRLFCLVIAGNLDGAEPIGSDACQWEADDEASKPHDTKTAARFRGFQKSHC